MDEQVLDAGAGSDGLIVAGLAAFIGFSAAEKLEVPVIGAGMFPLSPTSAFPSPFLPPQSVPRWLNRFSYRLVAELLWRAFWKATNAARSKVGLARAQSPVRSSHALRDLSEPVAATGRLAGQRMDVRAVDAPSTRLGLPPWLEAFCQRATHRFMWDLGAC